MTDKKAKMFLVIDLESTCEPDAATDYHYQTIEIGAVWASPTGEILDRFETLVQAESPVSSFCTQLTGITQADVDGGLPFPEAIQALAAFAAKHPATEWASYGVADLKAITRDCAHHGIESPLGNWIHRNLKKSFAKARKIKQVGMKTALEIVGIELDGTHHRALPDAFNIAKLLPYC